MKFCFALLTLLFGLSASLEYNQNYISQIASRFIEFAEGRGIFKNVIEKFIENIEGKREHRIDNINITDINRLQDILIGSNVNNVTLEMNDSRSSLIISNLTIPVTLFKVTGLYDLQNLELPGGFVIYGDGNFTILFQELKLFFSLSAKYKISTGLWSVQDVRVDSSASKSFIRFENLMNGEPMGEFLNFMIDELVKLVLDLANGFVEQYKSEIGKVIAKILNSIMQNE